MAKGKDHHVFLNFETGDDGNDGSEEYPVRTLDAARRVMHNRGSGKCTGIRVMNGKVFTSPCGAPQCGACTKANGRRLCPGPGCDKWISVSAKQHPECGWRKPEIEKKIVQKEYPFKGDDHHGFEKLKRKMIALAHQASQQYHWDGIIMGYAAKVGRGGSTARITYVSPQNELYAMDDRGGIRVRAGLDENLSLNADNALTLIRQKICPSIWTSDRMMKHDGSMLGGADDVEEDPHPHHPHHVHHPHHHSSMVGGAHGPALPPSMDDKGEGVLAGDMHLQWLQVADKRQDMSDMDKGPPPPAALHTAVLGPHVQLHPHPHPLAPPLGMEVPSLPLELAEDHKRKMLHLESLAKRVRQQDE